MYSIHHFFKKILFPEKCIACQKDGYTLCDDCITVLPLTDTIRHHDHYSEYTLFPYHHKIIKQIIWELKYKNNRALRNILCKLAYTRAKKYMSPKRPVYLFSIPKSIHTDTKHRDFDHGYLLVKDFSQHLAPKEDIHILTHCFMKTTTQRQASQHTRHERLTSIKGQIKESRHVAQYKNVTDPVIIIDDVVTTGATRDEMIKMVRKHFIGYILFITLAH